VAYPITENETQVGIFTMTGNRKIRVLHFVTGGFSGGATQVAIALVNAQRAAASPIEPLLVLRTKRHTPMQRLDELRQDGVPLATVGSWSNLAAIWSLRAICLRFKPDVLIAHGFSEHLWGRYAGLWAGVPHVVHAEQNTKERYTAFRLWQSRWLAQRSAKIVGCSEGVRQVLLQQGMPPEKTIAINNGVRIEPFANAEQHVYAERAPNVVMVARFSKQKDHATLLRAIAKLKQSGLSPQLLLAGGGKAQHIEPLKRLANSLGIESQVQFLGVIRNVPEVLMQNQIAVLSTHHEGLPLALIEGMVAGCAAIGTRVPGVQEMINDGVDGRLVTEHDVDALASAIGELLQAPDRAAMMAAKGRARALVEFSREAMNRGYERMIMDLVQRALPVPL
jgi:glycosyltransferase involved in cell wall biosynthesis